MSRLTMTGRIRLAVMVIAISVALAVIIAAVGQARAADDPPLDADIMEYLTEQCELREVPVALALAMIGCESGFNPEAVSATDDYGLMQINQINHDWLREQFGAEWDPLDAQDNIRAGLYIFAGYYNKYDGDTHKALMAYNMGQAGARRQWARGNYTSKYSRKVVKAMAEWEVDING